MNGKNNMMEMDSEETRKKKERKEKINSFKKKLKQWKEKKEEEKEDKAREKEEKERVKLEEEKEKKNKSSSSYREHTVTNETILNSSKDGKFLTPQDERRKKEKRKKIIRNIMTIPEIIIVVLLAMFLKSKYTSYSKDVHQILNYTAGTYVYEIHRDNNDIKVMKTKKKTCVLEPCEVENLSDYNIKFSKNQMRAIRFFLDLQFKYKNNQTKTITYSNLKTDYGRRVIFSLIHNNSSFLGFETYNNYILKDFEQMSYFTTRGYKVQDNGGKKVLYIAMGEKPSSGYALVVNSAYKQGDDIYFYIKEQTPDTANESLSLVTHPLITIELNDIPKNVYVYDVVSGEEYANLDAPTIPQPRINKLSPSIDFKDLADSLIRKD